jgi:hypothetical protein
MIGCLQNDESKGYGGKQSWPKLRYYAGICLEGVKKTTENLSQDSWSPGQDMNPGPPAYEKEVITTQPQCLVLNLSNSQLNYTGRHVVSYYSYQDSHTD